MEKESKQIKLRTSAFVKRKKGLARPGVAAAWDNDGDT
jgi:hypothetical protein